MATDGADARALAWKAKNYQEALPDDIGLFRALLEQYSNIPAERVDEHLYQIVSIEYVSLV